METQTREQVTKLCVAYWHERLHSPLFNDFANRDIYRKHALGM